jgi:mRNA interferase MazF
MSNIYQRQYEIWIADLDPSIGSEPGKTRPVVIIQSDMLNKAGHRSIIVCCISSLAVAGVSFIRIAIEPTANNKLLKKSYILCDQVRSIDVSRLRGKIGVLDASDVSKLNTSLKAILTL